MQKRDILDFLMREFVMRKIHNIKNGRETFQSNGKQYQR